MYILTRVRTLYLNSLGCKISLQMCWTGESRAADASSGSPCEYCAYIILFEGALLHKHLCIALLKVTAFEPLILSTLYKSSLGRIKMWLCTLALQLLGCLQESGGKEGDRMQKRSENSCREKLLPIHNCQKLSKPLNSLLGQ